MNFPLRDLTNQPISTSYQQTLQYYQDIGGQLYFLDGLGNSIATFNAINANFIDSSITSSMTVLSSSYSSQCTTASYSLTSSNSNTSSYLINNGINNYLPKWNNNNLSSTSSIYDDGVIVTFNTPISTSYIDFKPNTITPPHIPGRLYYNQLDDTLNLQSVFPDTTLQIGQEQWMRVIAGENIYNGMAVYITGSSNMSPVVKLSIADSHGIKYAVAGVATQNISSGSVGLITTSGQIHDLDTSAYNEGSILYLSNTVSGSYRTTIPEDPYETVQVGTVIVSNSGSGIIQVFPGSIPAIDYPFVGMLSIPTITSGSITPSGSIINISSGRVNLCTTSDGLGPVKNYTLPSASFGITSSFIDAQFIVATYNSGSPVYSVVTDRSTVDSIQTTLVYTVLNGVNNILFYANWDAPGSLLANKDLLRVQSLRGIERESGVVLNESGSRYVAITDGYAWQGVNRINISAINSSTNRLVHIYYSGSAWQGSLITQFNNSQYDNGSGLVTLDNKYYNVNWIYRTIGQTNTTILQLGNQYKNVTDAILSQPPTPPPELKDFSFLVGRAIYQEGSTTAYQIDSAYTQTFASTGITNHNLLLNLQGGSGSNDYYHMTGIEYTGSGGFGPFMRQTGSLMMATASWANNSISSSYILNAISASYTSTASYSVSSSNSISSSYANNSTSASYAIASTFTTSASYLSGSNAVVETLTVTGLLNATQISGSQVYITSSQLTITDNILTLNAQSPYLRYAGIEMYDSGSSGNLASFLWDGLNNHFFVSSSDAGYSRKLILGPDNTGDLTVNYIPLATGSNGLINSVIYQNGSNVGIGSNTFSSTAPEKLLVYGSTYNVISGYGNLNSYLQLNIKNSNSASSASSDIVATNDTGDETGNFIDVGINSSNFGGIVGNANDSYLYNTGSHLYIGNVSPNKNVYLFAGSSTNTGSGLMLSSSGNIGIGKTNPTVKLEVGGTTATDIIRTDNGLDFNPVIWPTDVTLALISGSGNVNTGSHYYYCSYYTAIGETELPVNGSRPNITTTTNSGSVLVTFPTSSDYRVVGRKLYRGTANSGFYTAIRLLATITNNTQSTFIDNVADASLTGTNYFFSENSTCKYITVNNFKSMFISPNNTTFGFLAGNNIGSSAQSVQCALFGYQAGRNISTGTRNTCIGDSAGINVSTGGANTLLGYYAGGNVGVGANNVVVGQNAMLQVGGDGNTLVGTNAAAGSPYGGYIYYNTCLGRQAGYNLSGSANGNTLIGYYAGTNNKTGATNICLGYYAGANLTSGSNNIIIGTQVEAPVNGGNNQLNIANIIFASGSAFGTGTQVSTGSNVGIGTNKPSASLHVNSDTAIRPLMLTSNINNFSELYNQNFSTGNTASTDIAVTNNLGGLYNYFIDMGINGSGYSAGYVGNANDAYLFSTGSNSSSLFIGSTDQSGSTYLFAGSFTNTGSGLVIKYNGNVGIGVSNPVNKLDVSGNISCSVITASLFYGTSSYSSTASYSVSSSQSNNALTASYLAYGIKAPISKKTTNYTLTTFDYTIIMSGSTVLTASLPSAIINAGIIYNIKNFTDNYVYVSGSEYIDSSTDIILTNKNTNLTIQSDGTQWIII